MCHATDYLFERSVRLCIDSYGEDSDYLGAVEQMRTIALQTITRADVESIVKPFLYKWGRVGRVVGQDRDWQAHVQKCIHSKARLLEQFRHTHLEVPTVDLTMHESEIKELYVSFKRVVKQTAATKLLHLMCPDFMPMWDTAIEQAFRAEHRRTIQDGEQVKPFSDTGYFLFVQEVQRILRTHSKIISRLATDYSTGQLRVVDQCFIWAVRRPLFSFLGLGE